jgi:copper resistance protein C
MLSLLFVVSGTVSAAYAHSELTNSVPADGVELEKTPGSVQLSFTEPVDAELASIIVRGPRGENLVVGPVRQSGPGLIQPITAAREAGTVEVAYRVVSLDGHPVSGEFTFEVLRGDPDAALGTGDGPAGAGDADGGSGGSATGLALGGVAVLLLLVAGAVVARRRGSGPQPPTKPQTKPPTKPQTTPPTP